MIRLQNDQLSRLLHFQLYKRMLDFAHATSPGLPPEPIVNGWINRLFNDDPAMHIIINFDESTLQITEHAVIEIQQVYASRIIICHQTQHDTPSLSTLDEGMEYMHKLAAECGACSIIFFLEKHSKAFMKRYGFTEAKTMMVKQV